MGEPAGSAAASSSEASRNTGMCNDSALPRQSSLWSWGLSRHASYDRCALALPGTSRYDLKFMAPVALPPERARIAEVLSCNFFALTWAALIACNVFLFVYDVDALARDESMPIGMQVLTVTIMLLYTLEIVLRLYVSRFSFFGDFWNSFDFAWVMADVLAEIIGSADHDGSLLLSVARILRLGCIVRIFRICLAFQDLYLVVQGMLGALRKILWSTLLMAVALITWSILAVEFINPLNVRIAEEGGHGDCERCKQAFQSVMEANLTFISNALAGDRWDTVCVPIMLKHPWTAVVFVSVLLTVQLGLLSLVLAVLVDGAQRVRSDGQDSATSQSTKLETERAKVLRLCRNIDADSGNVISLDKFLKAFDSNEELASFFAIMGIHREDLAAVFSLFRFMHVNGSGEGCELTCAELVDQLLSLKTLSPQRMVLYSYTIQNKIADGGRSTQDSASAAHGSYSNQLKNVLELMEGGEYLTKPAVAVETVADASSISHEWRAFGPKLAQEVSTQAATASGGVAEEEAQRCLERLRRNLEEELGSLATVIATSLREAAAARPPAAPPAAPPTLQKLPLATIPDVPGAFTVVDEIPPMSSSRRGMFESARKQDLVVIAEQVQKDLKKFQDFINANTAAAADQLGSNFPQDPVARDYQIALVQLQLHLNEGLSWAMADVMTKIHPEAQLQETGRLSGDLLLPAPPSVHRRSLSIGNRCGMGTRSPNQPCCGRNLVIVATD